MPNSEIIRNTYPKVGDNNNNLTDQIKSNRNLSAALCMVLAMLYDGNKVFWKDEGGELMISVCLTGCEVQSLIASKRQLCLIWCQFRGAAIVAQFVADLWENKYPALFCVFG